MSNSVSYNFPIKCAEFCPYNKKLFCPFYKEIGGEEFPSPHSPTNNSITNRDIKKSKSMKFSPRRNKGWVETSWTIILPDFLTCTFNVVMIDLNLGEIKGIEIEFESDEYMGEKIVGGEVNGFVDFSNKDYDLGGKIQMDLTIRGEDTTFPLNLSGNYECNSNLWGYFSGKVDLGIYRGTIKVSSIKNEQ